MKEKGFNIYEGSLGKLVDTKNQKYEFKYCLPNKDFPPNIHEFEIVIVDLSNEDTIDYKKEDHTRTVNKTEVDNYLECRHPQTIFDPRGFASKFLVKGIKEILKRECIIIVFQNENINIEYKLVKKNGDHSKLLTRNKYSLYEFMPIFPFKQNKFGKETEVIIKNNEFGNFLEKYNSDFTYENIYHYPTVWDNEEQILDPRFHPILKNKSDEIISFTYFDDKLRLYLFPILEDNSDFILEFLQSIAPTAHPSLFPNSNQKKWTNKTEYALPNHLNLLNEKELIFKEYQRKIKQKEIEIEENLKKYGFLHDIITETGDKLVAAVINFLEWLGFENVIDMDTQATKIKEEDIQIENEKGLLIIEVKGIGGTSKDSECSQISKIKYRRAKERGKFDVFGLYIVNHQRHLPAIERENPPFTEEQKNDALNDERSLLTTWQLFNLYYDIQNEIITKEEAREVIYNYGLISFIPQNIELIGTVDEIFLKGEVFILKINDVKLKTGNYLFIEKNNSFRKLKIIGLKLNDDTVEEISNGEIGIKVNSKVSKKSKVWIKNTYPSTNI
ncbi:hypothetical protein [Aquimarina sediminis]|uniref:hypothetical protein n=1 Tax=Aquimarina sediminis TaxID=2070536 RepID=UPI000FFEE280|nr:hypothetical protein [Aquimarina sediminis]